MNREMTNIETESLALTVAADDKPPIWPALILLFGLPLVLIVLKFAGLPISDFVSQHVSLQSIPQQIQRRLAHILFIPLGSLLVVFVRLSLGLRVLGPFRSILLALAFQTTGIVLGTTFLAITIAIVVLIRPTIRALKLPYFGRITVMLSGVAVLMTLGVMVGQWLNVQTLHTIAYFPIVVLCLVADAFARTMNSEGTRSALFRAAMTVMVAVALTLLADMPAVKGLLLAYPEILVAQIGFIMVIARKMNWRLLQFLNPPVLGTEVDDDEFEADETPKTIKRVKRVQEPATTSG